MMARRQRNRGDSARRSSGGGGGADKRQDPKYTKGPEGPLAGPKGEPLGGVPGWTAPVLYAVVTVILFRDFVFSDQMLVGQDTFSLGYVARAFYADALRSGVFPLWNPQILGGTPFLESLAGGDSLYPPSLLLLFLTETYRALGWKLVLHVFLAGCFMYLWVRSLGGSKAAALLSGLIYLLAPYMVTLVYPGHDGKLFVTALTPLLFSVTEWMLSRRDLVPAAAVGSVIALVILTTHFQMAYFLFGAVGAYMVLRCVQIARGGEGWPVAVRRLALFLSFSALGAGAAGIQLIPAVAYVTEFSRRTMTTTPSAEDDGVAYSASWSLHPEEAVSLVVPEFVGNSSGAAEWATGTYWGRNPFKTNHEYLGLVALLLALISFMSDSKVGIRRFLVGLGLLAFLFALGAHTPVWRILYEILPGVSLFRAPSMVIFLTGFSVATLAGLGLDRGLRIVSEGGGTQVARRLSVPFAGIALGWVLAQTGVLPDLWLAVMSLDLTQPAATALVAATPHIARGFLVALALAGAICAVWWAMGRRVLNASIGIGLIALLITVDEGRIDSAFIQTIEYESFAAPNESDQFLIEREESEEPFRVLSFLRNTQDVAPGMHGLELAAGHHPNDLARYRELIGMEGSGFPMNMLPPFHPNVAGLLNVRYILWPEPEYGPLEQWVPPALSTAVQQTETADGEPFRTVYTYPGLPRARIVGEAVVVPEGQSLQTMLDLDRYDPAVQVVLTEDPPIELAGREVEGSVTWVERTPNRLLLDVEVSGPALIVVAENWFPAWKGYVDGEASAVLRADHTLRAVAVPAGRHRVALRYESELLRGSLGVSLACGLLLIGGAGMSAGQARRRRERAPDGLEADHR